MGKLLYRYILREMAGPFLIALGAFIFVLLMGSILKIVDLIVSRGVGLAEVFRIITYMAPEVLSWAIPMALLIAGLVCFSRLSGDMEIEAIKAGGVSLYQLLPPVLLASLLGMSLSLYMTFEAAPWGAYAFRMLSFRLLHERIAVAFKEGVFNEIGPNFVVYADRIRFDEGLMEDVFIHDQRSTGVPNQIIAKKGSFGRRGPNSEILFLALEDGTIYLSSLKEGKVQRISFDRYEVQLNLSPGSRGGSLQRVRKRELDAGTLLYWIRHPHGPEKYHRTLIFEFHRRLAISTMCLIFGFLSMPLALQTRPRGRSHGFFLGMMVITLYYILFSAGLTVTKNLTPGPGIAAIWTTNVLFGALSVFVLVRTARERPWTVFILFNALVDGIITFVQRLLGRHKA